MDSQRKATVSSRKTAKRGERRMPAEKAGVPAQVPTQPAAAPAPPTPALPLIGSIPIEKAASLAPSAALVAVGLLLESELLLGIAIGTGIAVATKWAPEPISGAVLPAVNSTLKACYNAAVRTGEMLGEAIEGIEGAITGMVGTKPSEAPKVEEDHPSAGAGASADQAALV